MGPKPFSNSDVTTFSTELLAKTAELSEPITGQIDVYDAIARAIKYNADIKAGELEVTVENAKLRAQNASLLPDIVADSSYYGRGQKNASYSTLSPSYGASSDLAISWNILDFGLSYVRAVQAGDKALYRGEDYRKAVSKVAADTRAAYWRAVAAHRLTQRIAELQKDIESALAASQAQSKDSRLDPMVALNYGRDLLNEKRELNLLVSGLAGADAQIKQLINVPQSQNLQLKHTHETEAHLSKMASPADSVRVALENRSEVRQLMYQQRITSDEVYASVLQALPGIGLNGGLAGDSLSVLSNGNWVAWGAKAAWSLMNLLRLPVTLDVVETQKDALRQQAVAVAVTIAMQTYISRAQCGMLRVVSKDADTYYNVQQQIERQAKIAAGLGQGSKQALTRERLSTLLAQIRSLLAYADLQNAHGIYQSTLGIDPVDVDFVRNATAVDIAAKLRDTPNSTPGSVQDERKAAQQTAGLQ